MRRLLVLAGVGVVIAGAWLVLGSDERAAPDRTPVKLAPAVAAGGAPAFREPAADEGPSPEALPLPAHAAAEAGVPEGNAPEGLVLEVLHADGTPAGGCRVAVTSPSGAEVLWSATTDDAGAAHGAAVELGEGEAVAWIAGATLDAVSHPLTSGRGRHTLRLPTGEVIEGRIVVEGGPPSEPVPLGLEPLTGAVLRTLPQPLRQALRPFRPGAAAAGVSSGLLVGGDGRFAFSGLPPGWTGEFDLPLDYSTDDAQDLEVRAGERGRLLSLRRVPHLRFRVVSAGERLPVPGAQGMVTVFGSHGSMSHGLAADPEGRVDIPMLPRETSVSVQLDLASPDGSQRTLAQVPIDDPSRDLDLGDVELAAGLSYPFRAMEPDGGWIPDAVAAVECGSTIRSGGTDANGFGVLKGVPAGCAEMLVAADRHETVRVTLPAVPPAEPIEVVLGRCPSLELHVTAPDAAPRPGLELVLATERRVEAADKDSRFFEQARELGVHVGDGHFASSREEHPQPDGSVQLRLGRRWKLRELGSFFLGCFEAGRPIRLRLEDACGHAVWSEDVVLARDEQRVLFAELAALPVALAVQVVDDGGAPLEGVRVAARASEAAPDEPVGTSTTTDAQGRAILEELYAPLVDLRCEKEGYARLSRRVVPGGFEYLVMSRGHAVTLHCRDGDGRPAPVESAWFDDGRREPGRPLDDRASGTGGHAAWRLEGLPPEPVRLAANVAGRTFEIEHDPKVPEATLVVPAFGALRVEGVTGAGALDVQVRLTSADDGESFAVAPGPVAEVAGQVLVPLVFPGRWRVELHGTRDGRPSLLAGPVEVQVQAGSTATVSLR